MPHHWPENGRMESSNIWEGRGSLPPSWASFTHGSCFTQLDEWANPGFKYQKKGLLEVWYGSTRERERKRDPKPINLHCVSCNLVHNIISKACFPSAKLMQSGGNSITADWIWYNFMPASCVPACFMPASYP